MHDISHSPDGVQWECYPLQSYGRSVTRPNSTVVTSLTTALGDLGSDLRSDMTSSFMISDTPCWLVAGCQQAWSLGLRLPTDCHPQCSSENSEGAVNTRHLARWLYNKAQRYNAVYTKRRTSWTHDNTNIHSKTVLHKYYSHTQSTHLKWCPYSLIFNIVIVIVIIIFFLEDVLEDVIPFDFTE